MINKTGVKTYMKGEKHTPAHTAQKRREYNMTRQDKTRHKVGCSSSCTHTQLKNGSKHEHYFMMDNFI